jgi:hypothetical protein
MQAAQLHDNQKQAHDAGEAELPEILFVLPNAHGPQRDEVGGLLMPPFQPPRAAAGDPHRQEPGTSSWPDFHGPVFGQALRMIHEGSQEIG